MDNKLFKRIVAVAASAVMLTSSAFATVLTVGEDAWNDTAKSLTFSYNPAGATKVTYLAYAAREAATGETENYIDANGTKYVFGEIVAVNQLDGSEVGRNNYTETVPVNEKLLLLAGASTEETTDDVKADYIVLMSGADNSNSAATEVIDIQTNDTEKFTVTFDLNGGSSTETIAAQEINSGSVATAPTIVPTLKDYTFDGWYTKTVDAEENVTYTAFDFATAITANTTLYARYVRTIYLGDLDMNGRINSTDYRKLKNYIKSETDPKSNPDCLEIGVISSALSIKSISDPAYLSKNWGDLDKNDRINSTDYRKLKNYIKSETDPKSNPDCLEIGTVEIVIYNN